MVLSLSESDVRQLLDMPAGLDVVEESFRQHASGETLLIPRISQNLDRGVAFRIMPAALPAARWFGLKTLTGYPGRRLAGETYFTLLLFEAETGALRALIAGTYLTGVRTGAASGVAAKHMAREDASVLGVIGAGSQARYQLAAMFAVRPVSLVKVFDRDPQKLDAFSAWASSTFAVNCVAMSGVRETIKGSTLVVTATTASEPVICGDWLEPGTHVSAIGSNTPQKRELDRLTLQRSRIVVDSKEQVIEEAGDIRDAIAAGVLTPEQVGTELGEVILGRTIRTDPNAITLFKSVGTAIQDLASAAYVYEQAVARGIGTQLKLNNGESLAPLAANLNSSAKG